MTTSQAVQKPEDVEREAKKLFRRLCEPGARLSRENRKSYALLGSSGGALRVPVAFVQAFLRRDWIRPLMGQTDSYELSSPGRGWYIRMLNPENPFSAQHRLPGTRRIQKRDGTELTATVNEAESPVTRLFAIGVIGADQLAAAEKLRRDFTLAHMMPRLTADWSAPAVNGARSGNASQQVSDGVLAAKQRFSLALRAVGPGLSDLLFDVCCHLKGVEEMESARAWPRRSAKVMLGFALDRLSQHYSLGLRTTGRRKIRSWNTSLPEISRAS